MVGWPWLVAGLLVAGAAGGAVWWLLRARRRWLQVLVSAVVVLAVGSGAAYVWALATLDRSAAARALVWRDADVDDWLRFPAAPIQAGENVLEFRPGALPAETLAEVTLPDGRIAALDDRFQGVRFGVVRS